MTAPRTAGRSAITQSVVRSRVLYLAAVVLVAVAAWCVTPAVPDLDDAYIPLHSADSILAGHDATYGTAPLTGITSPPYLLLILVLRAVGLPDLVALQVATAMGLTALVVSIWMLARSVGLNEWQQALLPVMVLAAGAVVEQAINGVETGWAMAVAIGLIAACFSQRALAAGVAAGLLPWLRPDLTPLAGLLFVVAVWREAWPMRLRAVAIALATFMPWTLWVHAQTGAWFPNTMAAKTTFYALRCEPFSSKATIVALAVVAWLMTTLPASVLAAYWIVRDRIGVVTLVAMQVTLAAYLIYFPIGLFHNNQRYMFPIGVPLIALGMALGLSALRSFWRVVMAVVVVVSGIILLPIRWWPSQGLERVAAAEWVHDHVDPGATLMVQDAGVFSIYTRNPLVDFVGLKTPSSADVHRQYTWASCGADRSKAMASIARSSGAEYFIITSDWDTSMNLSAGLREEGVSLHAVRSPPSGEYGYYVYRITSLGSGG